MSKPAILNRIFWAAGTAGALLICYLICRDIFYELRGNKDWSLVMFVFGLAVIFISAFFGAKKVMVCTAAGYVVSFIAGIVFNSYHDVVVNGEVVSTNSTAWLIWTFTFLVLIFAGIVWEIVNKRMKRIRAVL